MYIAKIELKLNKNIHLKEYYDEVSKFIRFFINKNDKELKMKHYDKVFPYYSFSNFFEKEKDSIYKKDQIYTLEIKTLKKEFLDLKLFIGLKNETFKLISVNSGKIYFNPNGILKTETPVFFNTKKMDNEKYLKEVKEKIKENIIFRYLKSENNISDDINYVRNNVVKDIKIFPKVITIPINSRKTNSGDPILYHCFNVNVFFHDNDISKDVQKIIYSSGLGLKTSYGFGHIK